MPSMAMIAIRVPGDVAKLMERMAGAIPGDNQAASAMHVTLAYLGDGVSVETLSKAMLACHSVTSKTPPFSLEVREINSFEPGNKGTPIILPVVSNDLHDLQRALLEALDAAGVEYSKKWPEFKPHVTLSYVEGMRGGGPLPSLIKWGAFELTICGADHGDGGVSITMPFELPSMKLKLQKIAARIAGIAAFKTIRVDAGDHILKRDIELSKLQDHVKKSFLAALDAKIKFQDAMPRNVQDNLDIKVADKLQRASDRVIFLMRSLRELVGNTIQDADFSAIDAGLLKLKEHSFIPNEDLAFEADSWAWSAHEIITAMFKTVKAASALGEV